MATRILAFLLLYTTAAHAALNFLPGSQGQASRPWSALASPIALAVTDGTGHPVPGATVDAQVSGGPPGPAGTPLPGLVGVSQAPSSTRLFADQDGKVVVAGPLYGTVPGTFTLHFTSDYGSASLPVTITDGALPGRITVVSGAAQSVGAGGLLQPFKVQVLDTDGAPLPRAPVLFEQFQDSTATSGGSFATTIGAFAGDLVAIADSTGIATNVSPFRASIYPGEGKVTALCYLATAAVLPFTVTPGSGIATTYQDMWWGGNAENGWGLSVIEHDRRLFAVVFAYDASGKPAWYVVPDARWEYGQGVQLFGSLYEPTGSPYTAFDSTKVVVGPKLGNLAIVFSSPDEATLDFLGHPPLPNFAHSIRRMQLAPGSTLPLHGISDMWWGGASQSGWGLSVIEQPGAVFSVWYTYGADGLATWFVMPGGAWNASGDYAGSIYTTTNPTFASGQYDPSQLTTSQAGAYTLHLIDAGGQTRMEYRIGNNSASIPLSHQPF